MNSVYRVVWNTAFGEWRAAPEQATSSRKSVAAVSLVLLLEVGLYPAVVQANTIASGSCISTGTSTVGRVSTGAVSNPIDGSGTYATVAGCSATGNNKLGSTAFGAFSSAMEDGAVAFGFNSSATGKWATALGLDTVSSATGSIAAGYGSQATATNAVAIGGSAATSGSLSVSDSPTASGLGAVAIGSNTTRGAHATGVSTVALAGESTASGERAIAVGEGAQATANDTIAMGARSVAAGVDSIAIGRSNNVTAEASQALGTLNVITSKGDAVTVGDSNSATGAADNAVLLGDDNSVTSVNGIAVGSANTVSGSNGVALGNSSTASGGDSLALGSSASAISASALALGNGASASGEQAIAIGEGAVASGKKSLSIGHGNTVSGAGSGAFGDLGTVSGAGSYAVGNDNTIKADNAGAFGSNNILGEDADNSYVVGFGSSVSAPRSLAFGDNANAGNADSVALGSNSTTAAPVSTASTSIAGRSYDFAGTSPVGTVSVGSEDGSVAREASQRTLTNVAAGRVSSTSTDAVNGSQLFAATEAIETLDESAVQYDRTDQGALDKSSVTLEGAAGTKITNLAKGTLSENSKDAVNGSQLYVTNQTVKQNNMAIVDLNVRLADSETAIDSINGDIAGINADARYYQANSTGNAARALGVDSLAMGEESAANADLGVAIGAGAAVDIAGGVALGSGAVSDRVLSPDSGSIAAGGAEIPFDTTDYKLKGAVSLGDDGEYRQITNLADGTEEHDAVSLRQLRGAVGSLSQSNSMFFHANSTSDQDSLAIGEESVAAGPMTTVNADHAVGIGYDTTVENTGAGGVAIGDKSQVSGVQSVALGAAASAATANSVALGGGSSTGEVVAVKGIDLNDSHYSFSGSNPVGTVSIGGVGTERTLTNVAAGRISASSTDAVNGSQLHATNQALEEQRGWTSSLFDEVDLRINEADQRIDEADQRIDELAQNGGGGGANEAAVQYDAGTDKGVVTLGGEDGTTIANLADGEIASNSTDAVNGGQLWDIEQRIDNMEAGGSSSTSDTSTGPAASASGKESLAIGKGSKATAEGGVAIGSGSVADREGMNGTKEAFSNAEVASSQGAVSVGAKGGERQITHVAGGTEDTDAVNVRQLRAVQEGSVNYDRKSDGSVDYSSVTMGKDGSGPVQIHNVAAGSAPTDAVNMSQLSALDRKYSSAYGELSDRIDDVERTASAGIAAIAAMGDAPYVAGKFTYHVGSGYYNGETALGLDLRRTSDSGRWSIDAGIGGSSVDVAASLGISGVIN